jgi:DNA gyrase subunit A
MGRSAHGVRGMRLAAGHAVVSLIVPDPLLPEVLTISENGYGKRTPIGEFPLHGRGVQGVIAMQVSERNGRLVGALGVAATDQIMLSTDQGTLLRTGVQQISLVSRNTQGVSLMNVRDGETIAGFARVAEAEADVDADADVLAPTNEAAPDA